MIYVLAAIVVLIVVYAIRHYWFTMNRLFGFQRHPYIDVDTADWPHITVLIPCHNEETVVPHLLTALLEVNYPADRMIIMPINDRSTDGTGELLADFARRYPDRIRIFERKEGKPGKGAALKDATESVTTEVILIFDADYIPGKGLIKQLAAPFFDPEVGGVMGRVVPYNVGSTLLSRLLDLERAGGYQVDQQARMNMRLVPQHGGTVCGVRKSALQAIGNWRDDTLAEDTDLTYRLLLAGWKTVYQNRSECYEEVPETWPVRVRQISRWAKGHNQALARYFTKVLTSRERTFGERLDGLLLLGVFALAPITILGWILAIIAFYRGEAFIHGAIAILAVTSYAAMGNFAAFFEIAAAARLDYSKQRIRVLPFNAMGYLVSVFAVSRATLSQLVHTNGNGNGYGNGNGNGNGQLVWHKTERYRGANGNGNGHGTNGKNGKNGKNGNGHGKTNGYTFTPPKEPSSS
jgi:cellulose synthase/poly-beta-1,6-N-acetylglucosamine synthase-like glycosyltransferase